MKIKLKEVRGFNKYIGLMFQKKPQALVFRFNKDTRTCIHSYFCKPFIAIWIKEKNIIGYKIIPPSVAEIKPPQSYDTLIEIPIRLLKS